MTDLAMEAICFAADMVKESVRSACAQFESLALMQMRPSVLYRPAVYPDGSKWCALYGRDLMEGVAGFGDTPAEAMSDFDRQWKHQLAVGHAQGREQGR